MKIDHSDYAKWSAILFVIFGKAPLEENPLPMGQLPSLE
jgi:hypothetical protein